MNGATTRTLLDDLAALLRYPDAETAPRIERLRARIATDAPVAAGAFAAFADALAGLAPWEVEERFVTTFELQAPCCLEIGYQLFGETYKRGVFLVKLRIAAREHQLDCGSELPDHLTVVLRLLGRLGADEDPVGLCQEALLPALAQMQTSFGDTAPPHRALLQAIQQTVEHCFDVVTPPPEATVVRLPVLQPEAAP